MNNEDPTISIPSRGHPNNSTTCSLAFYWPVMDLILHPGLGRYPGLYLYIRVISRNDTVSDAVLPSPGRSLDLHQTAK